MGNLFANLETSGMPATLWPLPEGMVHIYFSVPMPALDFTLSHSSLHRISGKTCWLGASSRI